MPLPGARLFKRQRAFVGNVFRLDLPERRIELCFSLLPPTRGGAKPPLTEAKLQASLRVKGTTPLLFLGKVPDYPRPGENDVTEDLSQFSTII
ncbi:MAG: hypothetical protein WBM40_07715 [Thiohalocapsa sp.]